MRRRTAIHYTRMIGHNLTDISVLCLILHVLTYLLTKLSPSSESDNCAATQELPSILWNPKFHYRVHKSPPWSLSWTRSIPSIPSHPSSLRSILILSIHLRLDLHPSCIVPLIWKVHKFHNHKIQIKYPTSGKLQKWGRTVRGVQRYIWPDIQHS
jgi:hypothetical protein